MGSRSLKVASAGKRTMDPGTESGDEVVMERLPARGQRPVSQGRVALNCVIPTSEGNQVGNSGGHWLCFCGSADGHGPGFTCQSSSRYPVFSVVNCGNQPFPRPGHCQLSASSRA